ncbi:MAG: hypothetical protein ACYC75_03705, partial [Minisyncoccota bacterium]
LVTVTNPTPLTPGGTLTLNYIGLIAPLVEAVKGLAGEVGDLAKSVTTAVLNAGTVNTNNLCVKKSDGSNVCITGDQLDTLLHGSALSGGSASSSATSPAPSCTLSASPSSVVPGDRTVLSWNFPQAGTFTIDNGIGSVSPALSGTTTSQAIDTNTTFTGTAIDTHGNTTTCTVSVSLTSPIVITNVTAATSTVTTTSPPIASSTPAADTNTTPSNAVATSTSSVTFDPSAATTTDATSSATASSSPSSSSDIISATDSSATTTSSNH